MWSGHLVPGRDDGCVMLMVAKGLFRLTALARRCLVLPGSALLTGLMPRRTPLLF